VNLHSPTVFQIFRSLFLSPLAICLLSGEKATVRASFECPTNLRIVAPFFKSHSLRVESHDEVRQYLLSYESDRSLTKWPCPLRTFLGTPHCSSSSFSPLSMISQIMRLLSLEPVIKNSLVSPSALVSSPIYMQVIQLPCPFIYPLYSSLS